MSILLYYKDYKKDDDEIRDLTITPESIYRIL